MFEIIEAELAVILVSFVDVLDCNDVIELLFEVIFNSSTFNLLDKSFEPKVIDGKVLVPVQVFDPSNFPQLAI